MKIENRIGKIDEHSQKLEILNQNSNLALLGVDPCNDEVFGPPWSSPMEKPQNFDRSEKRKKNKEQLREK